jgi:hypothetical protein
VAEQTEIVTAADVTARLSTQAYTRLFARSGGSTVDTTFRDLCIAEANSLIQVLTRAAFPDGLYQTTDTLDALVVGQGVNLTIAIAASRHLATEETSGYAKLGAQAREFFKSLNRDRDARAPGSTQGAPLPIAVVTNLVDAQGAPTNPYVTSASMQSRTGY